MTIDERIRQLEEQVTATNQLLAELKAEREKEKKESVLEEYWNRINNGEKVHCMDSSNGIREVLLFGTYDDNNTQGYSNYPTKEYAKQAQKIKEFNDKLLAFKWCYDKDYIPDFSGDYDNRAYFIYYDSEDKEYDYDWDSTCSINVIYFSSKEIAQKCCDWLNTEMKGE